MPIIQQCYQISHLMTPNNIFTPLTVYRLDSKTLCSLKLRYIRVLPGWSGRAIIVCYVHVAPPKQHTNYCTRLIITRSLYFFNSLFENSALMYTANVRITKKPYTPQRERLHILWRNPVIFTDCGETP